MITEWTRFGVRSRPNDPPPPPPSIKTHEQIQHEAFMADPEHWLEVQEWRYRVSDAFWRGVSVGLVVAGAAIILFHLAIEKWPWYSFSVPLN